MPINLAKRYARQDLRRNPSWLFVFGDNLARSGLGGQAKECRGESNAVGIPTKRLPTMADQAFLSDADLAQVKPLIDEAFLRLVAHLKAGGVVILPQDGVGTGLARLEEKAPRIWRYLERCFARLQEIAQEPSGDLSRTDSLEPRRPGEPHASG
jgi:hypothetical protein